VLDLFVFFVVAIYTLMVFQLLESIVEAVRRALLQYHFMVFQRLFHFYVAAGMREDELGVGALWWRVDSGRIPCVSGRGVFLPR
jgi:hypothetical protein